MLDQSLKNIAIDNLERRIKDIEECRFLSFEPIHFTFDEITAGIKTKNLKDLLNKIMGQKVNHPTIYRISVSDSAVAGELYDEFLNIRQQNKDIKFSKINKNSFSKTIYVGSSISIVSRIKQHLYDAAKGTHALKMSRWNLTGSNKVKLELTSDIRSKKHFGFQDLEDALWQKSQPMFGKKGSH